MRQKQTQESKISNLAQFKVFGNRPENTIFLPQVPFTIKNDCKVGMWKVGEDDFRGKEIEISVIKVAQFFGNLGKTVNSFWLQLWFLPSPGCQVIPKNTVCLTYLKTRSIATFSHKVTELMESGDPALGIFKGSFNKHSGDKGDYYSVNWNWRERTTEVEIEQLNRIADFMATKPKLVDLSVNLIPLDGLSTEEIELIMSTAKAKELGDNSQHFAVAK